MKKNILFYLTFVFSILFFSCNLNTPNVTDVKLAFNETVINKICRATGTDSDNLTLVCNLNIEGEEPVQKTQEITNTDTQTIVFSNVKIGSVVSVSASVEFNKPVKNQFIEKFEGESEKITVSEKDTSIPLKIKPVVINGDADVSINEINLSLEVVFFDKDNKQLDLGEKNTISINQVNTIKCSVSGDDKSQYTYKYFLNGNEQKIEEESNTLEISISEEYIDKENLIIVYVFQNDVIISSDFFEFTLIEE